jgi:catechol 2,3-dioxygenase-like lactoylglutathione lyase family enzyme
MPLLQLDHVNLRTTRLAEMLRFYCEVLGLENGARPPFPFGGAWLYCGGRAVVHLVEVSETPQPGNDLHLEHFAFSAEGRSEFLEALTRAQIAYRLSGPPGGNIQQVNVHDPDGNHVHVDFRVDHEPTPETVLDGP